MHLFLNEVAKQIFDEYDGNFSKQLLVFPNRRSSLYFKNYLSHLVKKPVLSPEIKTINELFQTWSKFDLADPIYLIFKLYENYREIRKTPESFDEFYFWGEMIINDFDDIDKYLVDHKLIFQNLKDLRDIDVRFGGLEPEVIEIIRQFWKNFDPAHLTPEKDDFLAVWDILGSLYDSFHDSLSRSGMAYEGMMMRDIIEEMTSETGGLPSSGIHYHFIGFNALNKCEKELMKHLKRGGEANFYWDYDQLYVLEENHEAGLFIRDNLSNFGQDLKSSLRYDNLISPDQPIDKWQVYKAPSDVAQAKLIPGLLEGFSDISSEADNTAIVLADENMLMPVINSLPESVSKVNVTMGYPLYQTPVYSLVHQLISLRKNARVDGKDYSFYHVDVLKILSHQYITFKYNELCDESKKLIKDKNLIRIKSNELGSNDFFNLLFRPADTHIAYNRYLVDVFKELLANFSDTTENELSETGYSLQQEYLYLVITSLNQLESVFAESEVNIGLDIYLRIVDKILRKLIIPFTGEPLGGLQVMGILETRALDFKNIILISVNEGVLPGGSAGNSYIPYNLRMAFGLPTVKHQDSIYAYYFYRLIQRASKIRFLYNSSASGLRTGEMSRFLLQLKYNLNFKTKFSDSKFNIVPPPVIGDRMKRTAESQEILEKAYMAGDNRKALSPSALNTWINCRMRFYYRYIVGLEEEDNVQEEVDSPMFGTILHDIMNKLYSTYSGREVSKAEIDSLINVQTGIEQVVEKSFRNIFMRNSSSKLSGKNLIITSVLQNMVGRILLIDRKCAPFKIVDLERKYYREILFPAGNSEKEVLLGGTIDRVDELNFVLRILDYKSGKDSLEIDSLENLTEYNSRNRNSAAFQTFLYSYIYFKNKPEIKLRPSLYPVRSIYNDNFSDIFRIKKGEHKGEVHDFGLLEDDFEAGLLSVLADMFNPGRDFDMTTVKDSCKYCPFSNLCGRYNVM